jgi:secreted trypsin-like serine protease
MISAWTFARSAFHIFFVPIFLLFLPVKSFAIIGGSDVSSVEPISKAAVEIVGWIRWAGQGDFEQDFIFRCSGTLIAPDVVLTAAHCLNENDGSPIKMEKLTVSFALQEPDDLSGDHVRKVIEMQSHPQWKPLGPPLNPHQNDIALLRLASPAPKEYVPAQIARTNPPLVAGVGVSLAGYGVSSANDLPLRTAGRLRETASKFMDYEADGSEIRLDARDGHASCEADSGSPAFYETQGIVTVIGVDSRGDAQCDNYQIYTGVAAARGFLDSTMKRWRAKAPLLNDAIRLPIIWP